MSSLNFEVDSLISPCDKSTGSDILTEKSFQIEVKKVATLAYNLDESCKVALRAEEHLRLACSELLVGGAILAQ